MPLRRQRPPPAPLGRPLGLVTCHPSPPPPPPPPSPRRRPWMGVGGGGQRRRAGGSGRQGGSEPGDLFVLCAVVGVCVCEWEEWGGRKGRRLAVGSGPRREAFSQIKRGPFLLIFRGWHVCMCMYAPLHTQPPPPPQTHINHNNARSLPTRALSFWRAWGVEWKRLKWTIRTGGSRHSASRRSAPVRWAWQREQYT